MVQFKVPVSADDTYTILLHLFSEEQLGTFDKRSLQWKIISEAIMWMYRVLVGETGGKETTGKT